MREESVKAKRRGKKERSCGKSRRLQDKLQRVEGKRLFFPTDPLPLLRRPPCPFPSGQPGGQAGHRRPSFPPPCWPCWPVQTPSSSGGRTRARRGHKGGMDGERSKAWHLLRHTQGERGRPARRRTGGGAIKANVLKEIQLKNVCDYRDRAEKKDCSLFLKLLLNKGFDPEVSAFTVFCESLCALMAVKNLKL